MAGSRIVNGVAAGAGLFLAWSAGAEMIDTLSGSEDVDLRGGVAEVVDGAIDAPGAVIEAGTEGPNNTNERQSDVLLSGGLGLIALGGGLVAYKGARGVADPKKGI